MIKPITKKILLDYIPMAIVAVALIVSAILTNQQFIKLLPTLITLVVMLLNAKANRLGFLLGGINCLIYVIGYFMESLYGTVISTLFGAVLAFLSFARWKKRAYGKATIFVTIKNKFRILGGILFLITWAVVAFIMSKTDNSQYILDSLLMILGIIIPTFTMFAFLEAIPLNIISLITNLIMWIIIVASGNLAAITYLIAMLYNCYMGGRQTITWIKLYKKQRREQLVNDARNMVGE